MTAPREESSESEAAASEEGFDAKADPESEPVGEAEREGSAALKSESASKESAGDEARPSGGSGRAVRAALGGAGSSGRGKARAGPAGAGRMGTGRKPEASVRDQHEPPRRGGGGREDGVGSKGAVGGAGTAGRELHVVVGPSAGGGRGS